MVDLADSKVLNPNPNPKRHNRNHRPYGTPFRTGSKLPSLNPSPVHTWSFIRPAKTVSLSLSLAITLDNLAGSDISSTEAAHTLPQF